MRHNPYAFLAACLVLKLAAPARAAESPLSCPASITVPASLPSVPGWQALRTQGEARPLERLAIRWGADAASPAIPQSTYLREERGDAKTIIARWDLAEARHAAPQLWLACGYSGTVIELTRLLPDGLAECEYRVEYGTEGLRESGICR